MKKCELLFIGFMLFTSIVVVGSDISIEQMNKNQLEDKFGENLDPVAGDTQKIIDRYVREFVMNFKDLNLPPGIDDIEKEIKNRIVQYMRPLVLQNVTIQGADIPFYKGGSNLYKGWKWAWSKTRWAIEENESGPLRYTIIRSGSNNVRAQWQRDINPYRECFVNSQQLGNENLRSILQCAVSPNRRYLVCAFIMSDTIRFFVKDFENNLIIPSTIEIEKTPENQKKTLFFTNNETFVYGKQKYKIGDNNVQVTETLDDKVLFKSPFLEIQYSMDDEHKIKIIKNSFSPAKEFFIDEQELTRVDRYAISEDEQYVVFTIGKKFFVYDISGSSAKKIGGEIYAGETINTLAFSPDGNYLLTADNAKLKTWHVDARAWKNKVDLWRECPVADIKFMYFNQPDKFKNIDKLLDIFVNGGRFEEGEEEGEGFNFLTISQIQVMYKMVLKKYLWSKDVRTYNNLSDNYRIRIQETLNIERPVAFYKDIPYKKIGIRVGIGVAAVVGSLLAYKFYRARQNQYLMDDAMQQSIITKITKITRDNWFEQFIRGSKIIRQYGETGKITEVSFTSE